MGEVQRPVWEGINPDLEGPHPGWVQYSDSVGPQDSGHSSQKWSGGTEKGDFPVVGSGGWDLQSVAVLMTDLSIRRFQASVVNVNHFVGDLVPSWTVQQIFFWTEDWAI